MSDSLKQSLTELTQQLLDSIAKGDWKTYTHLCDHSLTAFEPEACGHLVKGMEFHKFYFDNLSFRSPSNTTVADVDIRLMGPPDDPTAAVVNYIRLVQRMDGSGSATTSTYEETRVWEKQGSQWKHVHFHRSSTSRSS